MKRVVAVPLLIVFGLIGWVVAMALAVIVTPYHAFTVMLESCLKVWDEL